MHELGKAFNITLNPDTPQAQTVLDIDQWDFDWQGAYSLAEPIPVKTGDIIRVSCTWNNSPLNTPSLSDKPYKASRIKFHNQQLNKLIAILTGIKTVFAHDETDPSAHRYVGWGQGTSDEMCIGSLAFLPDEGYEAKTPMRFVALFQYSSLTLPVTVFSIFLIFFMIYRQNYVVIKSKSDH